MAEQSRGNFHLDMSTEELMEWLREKGLGEKDLEIVKGQWINIRHVRSGLHSLVDVMFP